MGYLGAQAAAAEKKKAGATLWQPSSIDAAADAARGGVLSAVRSPSAYPAVAAVWRFFDDVGLVWWLLDRHRPRVSPAAGKKRLLVQEELGGEKAAPALRLSKTLRNGSRFSWAFQPSIAGPEQAAADLGDVQSLQQRASAAFL